MAQAFKTVKIGEVAHGVDSGPWDVEWDTSDLLTIRELKTTLYEANWKIDRQERAIESLLARSLAYIV